MTHDTRKTIGVVSTSSFYSRYLADVLQSGGKIAACNEVKESVSLFPVVGGSYNGQRWPESCPSCSEYVNKKGTWPHGYRPGFYHDKNGGYIFTGTKWIFSNR